MFSIAELLPDSEIHNTIRSIDMIVALRTSGLEHVLRFRTLGNRDKMLCHAGSKPSSLTIVLCGAARMISLARIKQKISDAGFRSSRCSQGRVL
jgi:hypothetical protein